MSKDKRIEVWTDGSALGNPGPGGYAILIKQNGQEVELSGGYELTTNNRMEMLAVIVTLEELGPNKKFTIMLDSEYTKKGALQWIWGWNRRGWVTAEGKPVKNQDLWKRLFPLLKENNVRFVKVKGHSGIPDNERVDRLAKEAAANPTETDDWYVKNEYKSNDANVS